MIFQKYQILGGEAGSTINAESTRRRKIGYLSMRQDDHGILRSFQISNSL